MTQGKGIQIVLAARPRGKVTPDDFRLEEFALPEPGPGEFLMKVDYLSLDPYMRGRMDDRKSYAEPRKIGEVMPGETISTIIASNHPEFLKGDVVLAHSGWRTHAFSRGEGVRRVAASALPVTTQLGVLGMPGFTAYAGMKGIGKPARGETVVVAAASGPVGSLVGQMARPWGLRAAVRNVPISKMNCSSMPLWIVAQRISPPSLQPPAHRGSMCISKMLEAQCGRLFFPS